MNLYSQGIVTGKPDLNNNGHLAQTGLIQHWLTSERTDLGNVTAEELVWAASGSA